MISVFDVYELMPRTDCGKCIYGSCLKMAEMLVKGTAQIKDCSVMSSSDDIYGAALTNIFAKSN